MGPAAAKHHPTTTWARLLENLMNNPGQPGLEPGGAVALAAQQSTPFAEVQPNVGRRGTLAACVAPA